MENEFVAKFFQDIDDDVLFATTISRDIHGDGGRTCSLLVCLGPHLSRSLLNVSWY